MRDWIWTLDFGLGTFSSSAGVNKSKISRVRKLPKFLSPIRRIFFLIRGQDEQKVCPRAQKSSAENIDLGLRSTSARISGRIFFAGSRSRAMPMIRQRPRSHSFKELPPYSRAIPRSGMTGGVDRGKVSKICRSRNAGRPLFMSEAE